MPDRDVKGQALSDVPGDGDLQDTLLFYIGNLLPLRDPLPPTLRLNMGSQDAGQGWLTWRVALHKPEF